jgi:hypothetical protein
MWDAEDIHQVHDYNTPSILHCQYFLLKIFSFFQNQERCVKDD